MSDSNDDNDCDENDDDVDQDDKNLLVKVFLFPTVEH